MSHISVLQELYGNNCKSENCMGIQIVTDNNSGWHVLIDLFDTAYEAKDFKTIFIQVDQENWVRCVKENEMFNGYGGRQNLEDILKIFSNWIKNYEI